MVSLPIKISSRSLPSVLFVFIFAASVNAKLPPHYVFFAMDREKIKETKSFLETKAFEGAQVAYSWRQLKKLFRHEK